MTMAFARFTAMPRARLDTHAHTRMGMCVDLVHACSQRTFYFLNLIQAPLHPRSHHPDGNTVTGHDYTGHICTAHNYAGYSYIGQY